jgi:hypothetical protein
MGARYLKVEEAVIRKYYPTAARWKIMGMIPDRTWVEISVKARKMGIHRTSAAKGNSVREGRASLKNSYDHSENNLLDRLYPSATHAELLEAFPTRTLPSLFAHARRRGLHRSKEAKARQVKIGRGNA